MNQRQKEEQARKLRAQHPDAAAFVDEVRKWFGPEVKVTYLGPARVRKSQQSG